MGSVPRPGVQGRDDGLHVGGLMLGKECFKKSGIGTVSEKEVVAARLVHREVEVEDGGGRTFS